MSTIPTFSETAAYPGITLFASGDSNAVSIPSAAQSLEGFRRWALSGEFPNRGLYTFIAGELIIDMSPEYLETHNAVKTDVSAAIYGFVKRLNLGIFFSDRFLLSNESAQISTEPDAMFARYQSFQSGRCKIVDSPRPGIAQELVGAPDWVLEIVSDTSVRKDTKLLLERYFNAGIGEYWLIDALGDEIDFQILVPGQGQFASVETKDGWLASPTFGCSFRLTRQIDQVGFWQYTLHIREKP